MTDLIETEGSPWALDAADVLRSQGSSPDGLAAAESASRLQRWGRNELSGAEAVPAWKRFLHHFDDVLIYILLAAGVLKAIIGDWVDCIVILVVAFANALIGFIQEGRAASALESLRTMMTAEAECLRDGSWVVVDATELVPGDVIRVRSGARVPADARLLVASNLQVDEAALTGESVPAVKSVAAVGEDAGIGDRSSMIYSGTIVATGNAEAVIVATGGRTEIGQISEMVSGIDATDTPLTRQLGRLAKQLSIAIGITAGVLLVVGRLVHGFDRTDLISAAIGFAVAAIPEGLPALVTITLALGVQAMARRNAITRKMGAVETLGSVSTICSDKTGTLTQNEMTARTVYTADARYGVDGTGYQPEGRITDAAGAVAVLAEHPNLADLVLAAGVCNDAKVEQTPEGWRVVGQPTEGALDVLAGKSGIDVDAVQRLAQVPFESTHKFSATLDLHDGIRTVHMVGAPDRLLDRCRTQLADAGSETLDLARWERRIDELSSEGLRVLAAASRPAREGEEELSLDTVGEDFTFLGLIGIVDPPRPEATAAIAECQAAGITVKMITGDHKGTAVAISRELGIAPPEGEVRALTGAELEAMSQEELRTVVRDVNIYARTSPEHKLRIVRALQSHGEVAAMTGDGVNDAPSITRADVGVAMGIKGTEATKDAADIVLADDNFATIERAVEEGRRIYANIRKSVVFLLPTNGAQSLVILVAVLAGWALPLSPVQILWVNLITAVTLSLALAGESAEDGIMNQPPRSPKEQVLSRRAWTLVAVASLVIGSVTLLVYQLERNLGADYASAQTAAVTMLAFAQLAFLFNCRFLEGSSLTPRVLVGNRVIWISAAVLVAAQLVFVYAPFMHSWFHSAPIGLRDWGLTLGLAVVVFLVMEVFKAISRATRR
ncbi:MAG TPA: HAD-IC family P-type ATPase [Arachnia sp.]|nr:HAD-IC family P-type ATPase [Arachnia sp.]HMT87340.1 HAD-IC family P-type ATPase [Arachnia sp.]